MGLGGSFKHYFNSFLDNGLADDVGRISKEAAENFLGKRPIGMLGSNHITKESPNFILNSNFSTPIVNTGSAHEENNVEINVEEAKQNSFNLGAQVNFNFKNLEEIKAHFNLAFEESSGIVVPISDSTLDPEKHYTVIFKKNLNSKWGFFRGIN